MKEIQEDSNEEPQVRPGVDLFDAAQALQRLADRRCRTQVTFFNGHLLRADPHEPWARIVFDWARGSAPLQAAVYDRMPTVEIHRLLEFGYQWPGYPRRAGRPGDARGDWLLNGDGAYLCIRGGDSPRWANLRPGGKHEQ